MKTINKLLMFAGLLMAMMAITNCTAKNPDLTGAIRPAPAVAPKKPDPMVFEKHYYFSNSESTVRQNKYDNNEISAFFQVTDKDGKSVGGLKETDFRAQENGTPIDKFKIEADVEKSSQLVDIVFVVDITGSMGPFIESAKLRLKDFINSTRGKYHVRLCLSTFGDFVVKKCDRFFDNTSPAQVKEFIGELAQLKISKGQGEDPRYLDWEENPMRALTEATNSPWGQESQRFVILVTDADFYSPDKPNKYFEAHQANDKTKAPSMKEVNEAIAKSQVRVFSVTPPATGYNSPLNGEPDITASSQGEWFEFTKVISKEITLDSILQRILMRINTTYKLTYVVDETPGLDPTLPLAKRNLEIQLVDANAGTVKKNSVLSSMPTGRPHYQKVWKVSDQPIQPSSLKVYADGKEVDPLEYSLERGEVRFKNVPKAGTRIRFVYLYEAIERNFRMEPLSFTGQLNAGNTKVYLNGKEARANEVNYDQDLDGNTSVRLNESVLSSSDPYDIRKNQGLTIRLVVN